VVSYGVETLKSEAEVRARHDKLHAEAMTVPNFYVSQEKLARCAELSWMLGGGGGEGERRG